MIFQHTNHKKLMMIHNLQTLFRLFVAIVYSKDLNISICRQAHYLTQKFSLCSDPFGFHYADTSRKN